jgi:hypothetical protein
MNYIETKSVIFYQNVISLDFDIFINIKSDIVVRIVKIVAKAAA